MRAHDLATLQALYDEVERELSGWSCEASADCCRFDETGREPYLWPNEWALIARALAARAWPPARGRSLPVAGTCPFLDPAGRCSIYDARPFGCRTFYCHRGEGPTRRPPRAALLGLGRRIATLSEGAEPGGGPRALTRWLELGASGRRRGFALPTRRHDVS